MNIKNLLVASTCVFGCAGVEGRDVTKITSATDAGIPTTVVEDDAGLSIGSTQQAISAKFSPSFMWGTNKDSARTKCPITGGGCLVPDTTTIRWRATGSEGSYPDDWQFESERAINNIKFRLDSAGNNWFFAKKTDGTHRLTFKTGSCGGNASTSNSIETYVCVSWSNSFTNLTESFPGTFQKWTGQATITVDQSHIDTRCGTTGATALMCQHQLQEHGLHSAVWKIMGGGTYASNIPVTTWSSSAVTHNQPGAVNVYDFDGLTEGELCQARSFNVVNGTLYTQLAGSCNDI